MTEEQTDYGKQLKATFQKLKNSKDRVYQFIVCEAKPYCGVMVSKEIAAKHKAQLTKLTGSKKFLNVGTCRFQDGRFVFTISDTGSGLASKLQASIRHFTGKSWAICVGGESTEGEEQSHKATEAPEDNAQNKASLQPKPVDVPSLPKGTLAKAPQVWHAMRRVVETNIGVLKQAIKGHYRDEHPEVLKQMDQGLQKLDGITGKLDHRIAETLARAHTASDAAVRKAELNKAKGILTDYIRFVKSEPLIAHIETNPFVSINLKQTLVGMLTHMAQAIG